VFGAMVCWLWSNRIVMNAWNSTVRDVKMEDHIIIHSDQWSKWLFFVRSAFGHGDGGACRDAPAIRSVKAFRAQPADTSKTLIGYLRIVSNLSRERYGNLQTISYIPLWSRSLETHQLQRVALEVHMLVPKLEWTPYQYGDSPIWNIDISLPIPIWGSPYQYGVPILSAVPIWGWNP
jgi:hypothetical protein